MVIWILAKKWRNMFTMIEASGGRADFGIVLHVLMRFVEITNPKPCTFLLQFRSEHRVFDREQNAQGLFNSCCCFYQLAELLFSFLSSIFFFFFEHEIDLGFQTLIRIPNETFHDSLLCLLISFQQSCFFTLGFNFLLEEAACSSVVFLSSISFCLVFK